MRQDIAIKWAEALESGEYPQTKLCLRDDAGFCCLGVLTDLYIKEHSMVWKKREFNELYGVESRGQSGEFTESSVLTREIMKWSHVSTPQGQVGTGGGFLAGLNDRGTPFPEIARLIRSNWEVL